MHFHWSQVTLQSGNNSYMKDIIFSCCKWLSSFSTGEYRCSVVAEPTISSLVLALVMATLRRRQSFSSSPNWIREKQEVNLLI